MDNDVNIETVAAELAVRVGELESRLKTLDNHYGEFIEADTKWSKNVSDVIEALGKQSMTQHEQLRLLRAFMVLVCKEVDITAERAVEILGQASDIVEQEDKEIADEQASEARH